MSKKDNIIIDLNMRDAQSLKEEDIIQKEALAKLERLISNIYERAKIFKKQCPNNNKQVMQRYHDVITIDGDRGTGKSTFILSIFELIRKGEYPESVKAGFMPLGIIDPTLVEGDMANIFISIISRIKSAVDEYIKKNEQEEKEIVSWNDKLNRLARGLSSVEGIGTDRLKTESWDDHLYILQEGLKDASQSERLEYNFHEYVRKSLDIIREDAFIIAFDDIDTAFEKGWPVLEVIRKYLTTPQLIVLLSGDIELYSTLVRKTQWDNFSQELVEDVGRPELRELVDKLEEQYLLKIFKTDYRIRLESMKFYNEKYRIIIKHPACQQDPAESDDNLLDKVLRKTCQDMLFLKSSSEIRIYTDYLLSLPIRTIRHILVNFSLACNEKWELAGTKDIEKKELAADTKDIIISRFHDSLIYIFQRELLNNEHSFNDVKDISSLSCINRLATNPNILDNLENGHTLKPKYLEENNENLLRIVLGAHYARYMKGQPASFFDYIVKVGLTKLISQKEYKADISEKDYYRTVGLETDDKSIEVARKITAFFRSKSGSDKTETSSKSDSKSEKAVYIDIGTIEVCAELYPSDDKSELQQIYQNKDGELNIVKKYSIDGYLRVFYDKLKEKSDDKYDLKFIECYNTLGTLEKAIKSWHGLFMNMLFSINILPNGSSIPYASIFNILGFISDLLDTKEKDEIRQVTTKYSQIPHYHVYMPEYQVKLKGENRQTIQNDYTYSDDSEEFKKDHYDEFNNLIFKWKEEGERLLPYLPVHIVARIRIRFSLTLTQMDNNINKEDYYLGYLTHQYIIAFLNAVLIELSLYNLVDINEIDLRDTVTDDIVFQNNIERWKTQKDMIKLSFAYFFSCPIWGLFLNPKGSIFQEYVNAMSKYLNNEGLKDRYKELTKVTYIKKSKDFIFIPNHPMRIIKENYVEKKGIKDQIVIVYAENDKVIADKFKADLERKGFNPDILIMDSEVTQFDKINNCYILILLSSNSLTTEGLFRRKQNWEPFFTIAAKKSKSITLVWLNEFKKSKQSLKKYKSVSLYPSYKKGMASIFDILKIDEGQYKDQNLIFDNLYDPLNSVLL
ncbi:MAG: hypothetical protein GY795_45575 [Desulfobacterales bacterium]|nr:hypothetical protein [Desulfobacterales bacterium]